jgi:hypothetical protein
MRLFSFAVSVGIWSFKVFRHWQNINLTFHKAPQKEIERVRSGDWGGQEVDPLG